MLCPEAWSFKAPESSFCIEQANANNHKILTTIRSCPFNHLVSVTLPSPLIRVPDNFLNALTAPCDYLKIRKLNINELISKQFISLIKSEKSLYLISINTRIDCDNCVAITPKGLLILNLNRTSYQSLGLQGQVSHFHTKTKDKYIVTFDLKRDRFNYGSPHYERMQTGLSRLGTFDVIASCEVDTQTQIELLEMHFRSLNYEIKLCRPKLHVRTHKNVRAPTEVLDSDFVEWLGTVSIMDDATITQPDDYVSTYKTPGPFSEMGRIKIIQWRGFFTIEQVARFWETKLKEFCKSSGCPWASMYVQGFSDSPVAWNSEEHHYYTNGDSGYLLVVTKDDFYLICKQHCSKKHYDNKTK